MFNLIQQFADWLIFRVFAFDKNSQLAESASYFIYDTIKIAFLLAAVIFIVSVLRSYLPPQKIKKVLAGKSEFIGNILAALIGIITPFCSCSAIPLFIGFLESGVPLGVTFSYLVSAPMVNEVAAVLLLGLFGWRVALIYISSGVLIAVITGFIIGRLKLNHLVEDYVWQLKSNIEIQEIKKSLEVRTKEAVYYTVDLFKKIFPFILLGVALGALIHGYAPENFLSRLAGQNNFFAVPLAVIIGVPLYGNAASTLPIVRSLIEKGLPLGTALAFMMAVTALSLPEMIILRRVLKVKLLAIYIGILTLGIIFTGYLFNGII